MSKSNNSKKLKDLCAEQERRKKEHVILDVTDDFKEQQAAQLEAFRLEKDRTDRERAAQELKDRTDRERAAQELKDRTDRERAAQELKDRTDRERAAQKEPTTPIVSISSDFNVGDKVYSLVSNEKGTINHIFGTDDAANKEFYAQNRQQSSQAPAEALRYRLGAATSLLSSDSSPQPVKTEAFGSSLSDNKEADKSLSVKDDDSYTYYKNSNGVRVRTPNSRTDAVDLKDPDVLKRYASRAYRKELKEMERDIRGLENKDPNEPIEIPANIKKGFDNLKNNRDIFKAEDIVYTPKVSNTMELDEFRTELTFASFDITKMSEEDKTQFKNFYNNRIYNKLYHACVWMNLDDNLNDHTMIFLIYEKDTYNIISICTIKDNKQKKSTEDLKQIIIVDFCNSINDQKSHKALRTLKNKQNEKNLIDMIYPYKGLGSIMMDKVLVAIKKHFKGAQVEINLIPTKEAEEFYKRKGFIVSDELTGKLSITYIKYMKYKDKYLKLKNIMSKN